MTSKRAPNAPKDAAKARSSSQSEPERSHAPEADPAGQSPDDPIEFTRGDEVARGNMERANAEPEPAALHDAQVPGVPDAAEERREAAKHRE